MPPDASETKRRILAAAREEFARYGLAGARVDRIAELANANKRSIYVHFGPKETLFEVVVDQALAQLEASVPFDAEDLPAYAGAMFDYLVQTPDFARVQAWAQLEEARTTDAERDSYARKVAKLVAAGDTDAVDTLALTIAMVLAWFFASPALRSLAPEPQQSPERLAHFRGDLVAGVRALRASRAVT